MWIVLSIVVVVMAIYAYAAIAHYYNFKHWSPFCGCGGGVCGLPQGSKKDASAAPTE